MSAKTTTPQAQAQGVERAEVTTGPVTRRAALRRGERKRRGGLRALPALVPLGVLAAGALVYGASNAAFTSSTSTGSNAWTAGTVTLASDAPASGAFSASNMKPGVANPNTLCVTLNYTGSLASDVRWYVKNLSDAPTHAVNLSGYVRMSIEQANAVIPANCTGFVGSGTFVNPGGANGDTLAGLAGAKTDWTSGMGSWPTAAGNSTQKRSYKVTWWLPDVGETGLSTGNTANDQTTLNNLQGASASLDVYWEAHNT